MPLYKYKVVNNEGKKIEGKFTANSKNEVLAMIRDKNYYPIIVEEAKEIKDIDLSIYFAKVSTKDLAIFCRQFYTMLNAGASILNTINILKNQAENKKLKLALNDIYEDVQKGITLSESMAKNKGIFPDLLINMVEAGEVSGNLDEIMDRMAGHFERENKINAKIKGAMAYPIVLTILCVLVVTGLLVFIMPTFMTMFESSGVELPAPTRVLLAISDGIKAYWYYLLPGIVIFIIALKSIGQTDKGKLFIQSSKLKIPIVKKTTKKIIVARFTRSLSTILMSGIPLIQALEVVGKIVGNKVVENSINEVKDMVMKGMPLSDSIENTKFFPEMLCSMIQIGEESGSLDTILEKTANFYDDEVEEALQKMTTLIEPIMIVIMGGLVGSIVVAMILPMFEMFNLVG